MFRHKTYQWRVLSCLAILASLIGNLQQCHAFCYLTSCEVTGNETHEECDCCACSCPVCACHQHVAKACDTQDAKALGSHEAPCESDCWCCRPADPLAVSSDSTDGAKKQLATGGFVSVEVVVGRLVDPALSPRWDINFRESDSLSATEFCVHLCRFRI
jgi:hypothetical protein